MGFEETAVFNCQWNELLEPLSYNFLDLFSYYGVIRQQKPRRIIQLNNYPTLTNVALAALQANAKEGVTGHLTILCVHRQEQEMFIQSDFATVIETSGILKE